MPTGTGLDAQLGIKAETVVGTAATVDHFYEFNSESLAHESIYSEPTGLRVGRLYKRGARLVRTGVTVGGGFEVNYATKNMGLLWKMALQSDVTVPTLVSGTAYEQVHSPGAPVGKSYTVQVGRPQPTGVVTPFTYNGCKCVGWQFSVSDGDPAKLSLDLDGWDETTTTALATATFPAAGEFGSMNASVFKLGGTVTTASGTASIASGTSVASVIKGFSLSGTYPLATERRGLGNSGVKKEQLGPNDYPTITGSLTAEFSKTELYDLYANQTATAIQFSLIGNQIAATGSFETLDLVLPMTRVKSAPPNIGGPDIIEMTVEFEMYDDEVNAPMQATVISAESTL